MTTTHTPTTLLALHEADPDGLRAIAAEIILRERLAKERYQPYQRPPGTEGYKCDLSGCWIYRTPEGRFLGINYKNEADLFPGNVRETLRTQKLTSLDAVAELEAGLTDEEHCTFRDYLWRATIPEITTNFGDDRRTHERAYISAPAHLRLITWVLTKQTI